MDQASTHAPGGTRDILVVDGDSGSRDEIGRKLIQGGYRASLCSSAREALDRMQGRCFDLILLDMELRGQAGFSVLSEIRSNHATTHVPVMMVSARNDPGAVIEALNAGADDHIAKPFAFDVLAARMERLIERARNIAELRRSNIALDERIAHRAIEIGELRERIAFMQAERQRLQQQIDRMSA
ncbi:response regulator transcription factor [Sphingomonas colocasiae]|uniref:Response regulator transcription factor n=1 Tax=Sphingomonas colocasiae TaxID=1848973 RepID=A0ABS7PTM6_9SPHN|nr:response regulator transcription factor [Sphingomonas colocasiae]MBY8824694.1 response regulator transcription factor [Sphingomonas colocasiae]